MPDKIALVKEIFSLQRRYETLIAALIEEKVPGLIDPVATTCDHGTACHGGGDSIQTVDLVRRVTTSKISD